jgi:hypothetical protein
MWEKILENATVLIAGILLYLFDRWWKQWKEKREKAAKSNSSSIETAQETDRQVRHIERRMKYEFHAMRMFIIHFSNGTVTEAGVHLLKITMKHEVLINYQVEPVSKYFQEIPMPEMLVHPFLSVVRSGLYHPHAKEYHDWLESYKVKSNLWVSLNNKAGKLMAILVMHFPANSRLSDIDLVRIKDMKKDIEDIYNKLPK